MSHTWTAGEGQYKTTFIGNSDLSGHITIRRGDKVLAVPGEHLIEFIAEFIRNEKIGRLEVANDMQVLMGDV